MRVTLPDAESTAALGRRLGVALFPGCVLALVGPLGAGKTTLVRGIAEGAGVDLRHVASPTFALIHEYAGRLPLFHFDTYRLPDLAAFLALGAEEYLHGDGACLVEWADRVLPALPADRLDVELAPIPTGRVVTLAARGERHARLLGQLDGAGFE
jgi:tRNA threonylcarbamoyladenosine biosynthesis protein TsaE